jgi:hypothetical protein
MFAHFGAGLYMAWGFTKFNRKTNHFDLSPRISADYHLLMADLWIINGFPQIPNSATRTPAFEHFDQYAWDCIAIFLDMALIFALLLRAHRC